jgi:hypothetical protein
MPFSQTHHRDWDELVRLADFDEYQRKLGSHREKILNNDGNQVVIFEASIVARFNDL